MTPTSIASAPPRNRISGNSDPIPTIPRCRTRTVIVQLTTFCNIDCRYCYLPDRSRKKKVTLELLDCIASRLMEFDPHGKHVNWQWHAGEPLTVGLPYFEQCHDRVRASFAGRGVSVAFSLQTNGTLIDEDWARFLVAEEYGVGVSIDGPPWLHDHGRKDRAGAGTSSKVLRGIDLLRRAGRPPAALCVVGPHSLEYGEQILRYLASLGVSGIGFNFEELEGQNTRGVFHDLDRSLLRALVQAFIKAVVLTRNRDFPNLALREFDSFAEVVKAGHPISAGMADPMRYINISADGHVGTFAPELAGHDRPSGAPWHYGHISRDALSTIEARVRASPDYRDIRAGIEKCRRTCSYFHVCGGGNPGNKLFENGTFDSTETMYCRIRYQHLVDAMLDVIEHQGPEPAPPLRAP